MTPEEIEEFSKQAIRTIQYRPDSSYMVLISGKALDLNEARKFTTYLNRAGAFNVATIFVDKELTFDEAVRVYDVPVPYAVKLWYAASDIWRRLKRKKTKY